MAARSRATVLTLVFVLASICLGLGRPQPAAAVGPTISFCFAWASQNVAYSQGPVFLYYWDRDTENWASVPQTNGGWSRTGITGCGQFTTLTPGFHYSVRAHYLSADYFVDGWTTSVYAGNDGASVFLGTFEVTATRMANGWNQGRMWRVGNEALRPAGP